MIHKIAVLTMLLSLLGATTASSQRRTLRAVSSAQRWESRNEMAALGGYMTWGSLDAVVGTRSGRLRIGDAPTYGVTFGVPVRPGVVAEFYYLRQPTELFFTPHNTGVTEKLFDMHVAYYQVGGLYEAERGRARPFGALRLGVTHFSPKDNRWDSEWRISACFGLGTRVFFTERIGLRVQADLLIPMNFYGDGMWCGPGGCSVGGTATSIAQGSFTGGLVVAF